MEEAGWKGGDGGGGGQGLTKDDDVAEIRDSLSQRHIRPEARDANTRSRTESLGQI